MCHIIHSDFVINSRCYQVIVADSQSILDAPMSRCVPQIARMQKNVLQVPCEAQEFSPETTTTNSLRMHNDQEMCGAIFFNILKACSQSLNYSKCSRITQEPSKNMKN